MRNKLITEVKKIIAAWYADNQEVYAEYREMVDKAITEGDMGIHEKVMAMLRSFIPDDIEQETEAAIEESEPEMEREWNGFIEELKQQHDVVEDVNGDEEPPVEDLNDEEERQVRGLLDNLFDKVGREMESEHNGMADQMKPEVEAVENVITEKIRSRDKTVFCYYYWMIFDNGPADMATIYSNHLRNNHVGFFWRWIFHIAFKIIVAYSFKTGARRMDWRKFLRKLEDGRSREDVEEGLSIAMPSQGKRVDCRSLDELITNPHIIDMIGVALEKRKSDVDIAFLLMNLQLNRLIPDVAYTTFHRALQNAFPLAGIKGYGKAQAKYKELKILYNDKLNELYVRKKTAAPSSLSHEKQVVAKLKVEAYDIYFDPLHKNREEKKKNDP